MTMLADDLSCIFADTSLTVPVVCGTQTVRGFLKWNEVPQSDPDGGFALIKERTVTVRDGTLSGLVQGATLTVDGASYKARELRRRMQGHTVEVVIA